MTRAGAGYVEQKWGKAWLFPADMIIGYLPAFIHSTSVYYYIYYTMPGLSRRYQGGNKPNLAPKSLTMNLQHSQATWENPSVRIVLAGRLAGGSCLA